MVLILIDSVKPDATNETSKTVRANCKECKFSANSNVSQLIQRRVYPIFRDLKSLGRGIHMSRQQPQLPVSSPRLLASAIGVAITAGSAGHMVFAAEKTDEKAPNGAISLDATAITGEAQDQTILQGRKSLLAQVHRAAGRYAALGHRDSAASAQGHRRPEHAGRACAPFRASPSVPVKAATRRATVRSFAASTPRATPTWTACATPVRKAAKSSPSNRSKSAKARTRPSVVAAPQAAASTW